MSTVRFTAGYVPGISHEELAWHTLEYRENDSRLEVKVPILTQAQMLTVTQSVKNACNAQIKTMDVSEIDDDKRFRAIFRGFNHVHFVEYMAFDLVAAHSLQDLSAHIADLATIEVDVAHDDVYFEMQSV